MNVAAHGTPRPTIFFSARATVVAPRIERSRWSFGDVWEVLPSKNFEQLSHHGHGYARTEINTHKLAM